MPSSMKNIWILWLLNFYQKTTFHGLFNYEYRSQNGICPYIFGDIDYPFLPWLMIPHKHATFVKHIILEVIFNKHYEKKGCFATNLATHFIYMPWVRMDKLHELQSCNSPYISPTHCISIAIVSKQLFGHLLLAPMGH
jgi:hypothetical protein